MKEKKAGQVIILIAFALICLSKVIWFFTAQLFDDTNHENRQMAQLPELSLDSYHDYSADYTEYFNDNLQFRNSLISLNSSIDYFCFGRSSSDNVIVGENNWLFYNKTDDGDPMGCYQGTNLFTEKKLEGIAENCTEQRDYLLEQGKEFVILIIPNKERMYSEYMPKQYGDPADDYATKQLVDYLHANTDLRVIYIYDELMDVKNSRDENIYYKTDTHWNPIGGYVGATALLAELGIKMPDINNDKIKVSYLNNTSGDLANLLNLGKQLRFSDSEYCVEGYDEHGMDQMESDFGGLIRYHATDADPRKIYVIRDSFFSQMEPYIGSQFADSYLRHKWTYSYDDLVSADPDIVVYETVERYVGELSTFSIK